MELSPSWEAASCAATQELPIILWNPKVPYPSYKISRPFSLAWAVYPGPRPLQHFVTSLFFTVRSILDPQITSKLEDHPLSAIRDRLLSTWASVCCYVEAVSSLPNPRRAVLTRDELDMVAQSAKIQLTFGSNGTPPSSVLKKKSSKRPYPADWGDILFRNAGSLSTD
jgi:hypothetical protein